MAQQLYFSRDSKLYIEFGGYIWDVPVLDGFSFSQATNSSEITLNEMESAGGVSRRGRRAFNDSLAPGEWSFATYVRPFASSGSGAGKSDDTANMVHAVEEVLWNLMAGATAYDTAKFDFENTLVINATDMVQGETYEIVVVGTTDFTATNVATFEAGVSAANTAGLVITAGSASATGNGTVKRKVSAHTASQSRVSFHASNSSTLGTANMYFVLGEDNRKVMKLKGCTVNEASIDFDIDGIATINWSGNSTDVIDFSGKTITQAAAPGASDTTADGAAISAVTATEEKAVWLDSDAAHRLYTVDTSGNASTYINEKITSTSNFIRNRLTVLTAVPTSGTPYVGSLAASGYNLTLTGGNITINNNNTYITPEEIGIVNVPIGHITGTRTVSGSFTCYLTEDTSATNASADLFEDLRSITSTVTNSFALTFKIGGATGTGLEVTMPTCHIEIPTHSVEDVIALETNFQALPSNISGSDEVSLTYRP